MTYQEFEELTSDMTFRQKVTLVDAIHKLVKCFLLPPTIGNQKLAKKGGTGMSEQQRNDLVNQLLSFCQEASANGAPAHKVEVLPEVVRCVIELTNLPIRTRP
jgi:hypothetical protein